MTSGGRRQPNHTGRDAQTRAGHACVTEPHITRFSHTMRHAACYPEADGHSTKVGSSAMPHKSWKRSECAVRNTSQRGHQTHKPSLCCGDRNTHATHDAPSRFGCRGSPARPMMDPSCCARSSRLHPADCGCSRQFARNGPLNTSNSTTAISPCMHQMTRDGHGTTYRNDRSCS